MGVNVDLTKTAEIVTEKAIESFQDDGGRQLAQQIFGLGADVVRVFRLPLRVTLFGADKLNRLATQLEKKVPRKNRQLPPARYATPALEEMAILDEESTLYAMFLELLAASADSSRVDALHPRYIKTLASMSADEAALLRYVGEGKPSLHRVHGSPDFKFEAPPQEAIEAIGSVNRVKKAALDLVMVDILEWGALGSTYNSLTIGQLGGDLCEALAISDPTKLDPFKE